MLGLALGFKKNNRLRRNIIKEGLLLYLDSKDFKNGPPTTMWIDKAKNTLITYNNLALNGDFEFDSNANGLADYYSAYGGSQAIFTTDDSTYNYGTRSQKLVAKTPCNQFGIMLNQPNLIVGHKYYFAYFSLLGLNNIGAISNDFYVDNISIICLSKKYNNVKGTWNKQASIFTAQQTSGYIYMRSTNASVKDDTMNLDSVMLIDLTALFGAGNEPTVDECDLIFPFTPTSNTIKRGYNATPRGIAYTTASGSDNLGGIVFDGVDDFFTIEKQVLSGITTEVTIGLTLLIKNFTNSMFCASNTNFNIRSIGGILSCLMFIDGANLITTSNYTLLANVKYNIVFTFKNKQGRLFVNGVEVGYTAQPVATTGIITDLMTGFLIGKRSDTPPINGILYNAYIYNRSITEIEICKNLKILK